MPVDDSVVEKVQGWRRSVVRAWVVTMVAALLVWAAAAVWTLTSRVEISAAAMLLVLAARAFWLTRTGHCPRCGAAIRFEPRVELPPHCPDCRVPFSVPPDG